MPNLSIKSVCGYCGVGCGVSYESKVLKGDKHCLINKGTLCAKGSSELLSIQSSNRLLTPEIRSTINEVYMESSWEESIDFIAQKIKVTNPKKVGFYLSGQMLTEDYYTLPH
jgi:ferredoxin-nitrate reductase